MIEVDVAIMLHDLSETGVARNALAIAEAAQRGGLRTEIWVVCGTGPLFEQIPRGVDLITLGGWGGKLKNRRLVDIAAIGNLAKAYRQRRPRVALSAGNHFHIAASAAFFLAGSPNSVRLLFRASNPPFRGRYSHVGPFLAWLYRLRFRGARRIISVSAELREILVKNMRIAPARVLTITNSIEVKAVAERSAEGPAHPWFSPDEPPVILGIGRLAPQKNFELLIRAFARVRRVTPSRLVIIGEGAGAHAAKLKALAESLGLTPDDLWFAGRQANPFKFMAQAGLFVLSSNWEGMSNVLLEAMACGCPVVATDCPTGVREQMQNGRIGPIVPLNNWDELATAMIRRLGEPRASHTLMEFVARFDRDHMLLAYEHLFKSEIDNALE